MQLPHLNAAEAILLGVLGKATFDNAVANLAKPSKSTGFYYWFYGFIGGEKAAIDGYLDARFHIPTEPVKPAAPSAAEGK